MFLLEMSWRLVRTASIKQNIHSKTQQILTIVCCTETSPVYLSVVRLNTGLQNAEGQIKRFHASKYRCKVTCNCRC